MNKAVILFATYIYITVKYTKELLDYFYGNCIRNVYYVGNDDSTVGLKNVFLIFNIFQTIVILKK